MLDGLLPILYIQGPEGEQFSLSLDGDKVTIGRFRELNDVALEPDPQHLITRKGHCLIERIGSCWWLVDNGSVNRTFLKRDEKLEVVAGRVPLNDGDVVCILGRLYDDGSATYWELLFRDPLKTQRAETNPTVPHLEYDWIQARLFRISEGERAEIHALRPQEHKLIRYMDQRNRANEQVPVMCTYDELIAAIWGDEVNHSEAEINHLVWELRQKVELNPKEPSFLQAVRGLGYRLTMRPTGF